MKCTPAIQNKSTIIEDPELKVIDSFRVAALLPFIHNLIRQSSGTADHLMLLQVLRDMGLRFAIMLRTK